MDSVFDAIPIISIITEIELLCWKTEDSIENKVQSFMSDSITLEINKEVVEKSVSLRRHKKVKTPDAIIVDTALAYGYTLVTNIEKDFIGIEGLRIVNPMKI